MLATKQTAPAWEKLACPEGFFPAEYLFLSQAKVCDRYIIILVSHPDPNHIPAPVQQGRSQSIRQTKSFWLFDMEKHEYSRIHTKLDIGELLKKNGIFQILCQRSDMVVFMPESSRIVMWKFKLSQDSKTILSVTDRYYELISTDRNQNSSGQPSTAVLYKQNIFLQVGTYQNSNHQTGAHSGGVTYNQKLITLDINTGVSAECKKNGAKPPDPTDRECAVVYENSMYLFRGQANKAAGVWKLNLDNLTWEELTPKIAPHSGPFDSGCVDGDNIYLLGANQNSSSSLFGANQSSQRKDKDFYIYNVTHNSWKVIETDKAAFNALHGPHSIFYSKEKLFLIGGKDFYSLHLNNLVKNNFQGSEGDEYSDIKAKQKSLFTERLFPDIVFKVEQREISAHKGVLSAGCKFFKDMFTSGMEESEKKIIEVPDMKATVFESLLEYIYCSDVAISEEFAWGLFEASEKYRLSGLKRLCEDFLINRIAIENVIHTINSAERFEANKLRNAGLKFFVENIESIFKEIEESEIYKLKKGTLFEIYNMKP